MNTVFFLLALLSSANLLILSVTELKGWSIQFCWTASAQ